MLRECTVKCRVEAGDLQRWRKASGRVINNIECSGEMQRRERQRFAKQIQNSGGDRLMLAQFGTSVHNAVTNNIGFRKMMLLKRVEKIFCSLPGVSECAFVLK